MVSNGQISMIDKLFKAIRNVCRLSRRKKEGHDPPPPSAMILRKRHPEKKWRGRRGWKVISQLIMRYRVCLMFRRWRSERGSERKEKEKKKKGGKQPLFRPSSRSQSILSACNAAWATDQPSSFLLFKSFSEKKELRNVVWSSHYCRHKEIVSLSI